MALRVRVPRIALVSGQNISLNLLTSSETFYNATVSATADISTNLLPSTETFFNAIVTPGTVDISCTLLASTENIFPAFVIRDDKTIVLDLLSSTNIFPLLTLIGGIANVDTSDILKRKSGGKKKQKVKTQAEIEEENVAAQILKARQQGKEELKPARKKALELKLQLKLKQDAPPEQIIEVLQEPEFQFNEEEQTNVINIINEYKQRLIKQKRNKQLQALMIFLDETGALDD